LQSLNRSAGNFVKMKRGTVLWTLAALLGIGLTAGVTWGASLLFSQPIGLASQPASVIDTLAPRTQADD
jgi:hypothetical protein